MADATTLAAPHARHDAMAVAAAVDRTAMPDLARVLLAACPDCVCLHADLGALATALQAVRTPARRREFTLTRADAERLRPRGPRRWLTLIGSSVDGLTRPLAIGFTTLGLAGLLIATVPGAIPGGGVSAAGAGHGTKSAVGMGTVAPVHGTQPAVPSAGSGSGSLVVGPAGDGAAPRATAIAPAGPSPFIVLSSVFLLTGAGLFAVRRVGRHGTMP